MKQKVVLLYSFDVVLETFIIIGKILEDIKKSVTEDTTDDKLEDKAPPLIPLGKTVITPTRCFMRQCVYCIVYTI